MSILVKKYKFAVISVDVVIFTVKDESLQVLLIKMKKKPFLRSWAAPGGLIKPEESVEQAAKRLLKEKTDLSNVYLEQLYTFGKVNRDPFGRVVSVAYIALIPKEKHPLIVQKGQEDICWHKIESLPKLAYDHLEMINKAVRRLRAKLSYTNIVCSLLPGNFTLGELQKIYEIILKKSLDKRNFRKKIHSIKLVQKTGKRTTGAPSRPAQLYRFTSKKPKIIDVL